MILLKPKIVINNKKLIINKYNIKSFILINKSNFVKNLINKYIKSGNSLMGVPTKPFSTKNGILKRYVIVPERNLKLFALNVI